MEKKNLKQWLQAISPDQLFSVLVAIFIIAVIVLALALSLYVWQFHDGLSTDREAWGQFGDFLGGMVNPIVSFLALIALLLTVVIQSRQLELSKDELKATREELKRSADAQERLKDLQQRQSLTMELSATISAISHLADDTETKIARLKQTGIGTPKQQNEFRILEERKTNYINELAELHARLKSAQHAPAHQEGG